MRHAPSFSLPSVVAAVFLVVTAAVTSTGGPLEKTALKEPPQPNRPYDATAEATGAIAHWKVKPGDWPQWGGWTSKNNTPLGKNIPVTWDVGEWDSAEKRWMKPPGENVKWTAQLGTVTYGTPVIANGKVYIATNNGAGYVKRYPAAVDLGCLLCFDEETGKFLWQHSNEKLATGRAFDAPMQGCRSTPLVDGNRLWYVTNRAEIFCLDTDGFRDFENDGPVRNEPLGPDEADVVWKFDMMARLNVSPVGAWGVASSFTCVGDRLFIVTGHGTSAGAGKPLNPVPPSFLALDRRTGEILWTDDSPGENILNGQWSSPAYDVLGGVAQVIFGGGDGWLYSFDPAGENGKSKLLWKFDCNPKEGRFFLGGRATRNHIIGTPVIYDGLVYVAVGEEPEHGEGPGHLWCIDPTKSGDVSPTQVFNMQAPNTPIARKRLQALNPKNGDFERPNLNSAAVWHYTGSGPPPQKFGWTMHRTSGTAAIKNGLLFIADFSGLFHCVNVKTGQMHWTHDLLAASWGSPLIVENHVYIGDEDGDVTVFELSAKKNVINEITMGDSLYNTPVVANNVLFIANRGRLYAISQNAPVAGKAE